MKARVQDKIKAISLRMQGYTYQQIMQEVPVSKGLLSGWLQRIRLSQEQEQKLLENIKERSTNGRDKAAASNMKRRKSREALAEAEAHALYETYKDDRWFILGVSLYWSEGGKRTSGFQFVNSDPDMIQFMLYWVQKYLGIKKTDIFMRLNTHVEFKTEHYEDFWSEKTGIPLSQFAKTVYKPNRHGIYKKNPLYKGCARLEIRGGMALLRKVVALQHVLISEAQMLYSQG